MTPLSPRPVRASHVALTELMIPSYANFGGKVHGGVLLRLMDQIAYASAARHAGTYCVTVSVDGAFFRAPVEVGELVTLRASVNWVGRTSLVVGIRVESENVTSGEVKHTNTSFFTMVAKNEKGEPQAVPPLLLETRDEARRYLEALTRRNIKARYEHALDDANSALAVHTDLDRLVGQRCVLGSDVQRELGVSA